MLHGGQTHQQGDVGRVDLDLLDILVLGRLRHAELVHGLAQALLVHGCAGDVVVPRVELGQGGGGLAVLGGLCLVLDLVLDLARGALDKAWWLLFLCHDCGGGMGGAAVVWCRCSQAVADGQNVGVGLQLLSGSYPGTK
jgi:hypothetical protein